MVYRVLTFVPTDPQLWPEELHAVLEAQAMEGFHFVGSLTRTTHMQQPGGMGVPTEVELTALVFGKES